MSIQKPLPSDYQEIINQGILEGLDQVEIFRRVEEAADLEAARKAREESDQRFRFSPTQIAARTHSEVEKVSTVGYVSWLRYG